MKNKRKGISLIVLVITIIVVIILATAVLVNIVKSNPIAKAEEAISKRKIAEYTQITNVIILTSQAELYENKEEKLIDIINKNIKKEQWYENSSMYDDKGFLVEKNGIELIVRTKDGYEICINVNDKIAYVEYVSDKPLKSYILTYIADNEKNETITQNVREGKKVILKECEFEKGGYKFVGWAEDKDTEKIYPANSLYPENGITSNVSLYARWEKNVVEVTYNGNGGKLPNSDTSIVKDVKLNSVISLPQNTFINKRYDFVAWVAEDGTEYLPGAQYKVEDRPVQFRVKWEYKIKEELSYLVTDGTQYIDTGIIPNQDTTVEMKFMMLSTGNLALFGLGKNIIDTETREVYSFDYINNQGFRSCYGNDRKSLSQVVQNPEVHIVRKEKNNTYIDGNLKMTQNYLKFSTPSNLSTGMLLFNCTLENYDNTKSGADLKFYYCKIFDNDVLVRDFIPVIDNKGKICLYDQVEDKMYYAKHTTGQQEFERDSEYARLKSINVENTYVDTGIIPNQDTAVEMKFILLSQKNQSLFGLGKEILANNKDAFMFSYINGQGFRTDYNDTRKYLGVELSNQMYNISRINVVKIDKGGTYIDGNLKMTQNYSNFSTPSNLSTGMLLFNCTLENYDNTSNGSNIRFYYCKIWDNGTLVRDYIPVVDSKDKICLLDKVENKKYNFVGGNQIIRN